MQSWSSWPLSSRLGNTTQICSDIRRQLAVAQRVIIAGFLVAALLLSGVVFLHFWRGILLGAITRDPAVYFVAPAYIGAISYIGIMMWASAAAISLFGAGIIWRAGVDREDGRFLAWSGFGTLYLAIDDAILLHEVVISN